MFVGGGHLIAHCCSLYLLVDMCVERAYENYDQECLCNISVFQRTKALRSAFVQQNVKVEEGDVRLEERLEVRRGWM